MLAPLVRPTRRYGAARGIRGGAPVPLTFQLVAGEWFVDTTAAAGDAFATVSAGLYSLDTTAVSGLPVVMIGDHLFLVV